MSIMPGKILGELKKNDLSFYCMLAVLVFSLSGGFAFSVTIQTLVFLIITFSFCFLFINRSFPDKKIFLVFLPVAVVVLSYFGADFQVNIRNASLGLINAVAAFFIMAYSDGRNKENITITIIILGLWVSFMVFMRFLSGNANIEMAVSLNINIIAGFLLLIFPLVFCFEGKKNYALFLFFGLIIFSAIILTKSRAAILISYLISFYFFITLNKSRFSKIFFFTVSAIVICGLIYAFSAKAGWGSFSDRIMWWKTAWLMFKDHPFLGIGFGNYGAFFTYYRPELVINTLFAHNIIFQLLAETGIAGLLSFCTLFFIIFKKAFSNNGLLPVNKSAIKAALLGFIAFNFTDYSFFIPLNMIIFFTLCGILYSGEPVKRKTAKICFLVFVPALYAALVFIYPLIAENYYEKGSLYFRQKEYTEAERNYLLAVKYDKKNPVLWYEMSESWLARIKSGDEPRGEFLEKAIENALRAEFFYGHSGQIKVALAYLYKLKGDEENSAKYLNAAIQTDRFNPFYKQYTE